MFSISAKNFIIFVFFTSISCQILSTKKCPKFQSVVRLNSSLTESNYSYAIIADGKYYLIDSEVQNEGIGTDGEIDPEFKGFLPKGFTDNTVTLAIDSSHCNRSDYYLLTIRKQINNESDYSVMYTTLDLKDWTKNSLWSEPKPLSDHPMFSMDPYFKMMSLFGSNFDSIEFDLKTMFYWSELRIIIVVLEFRTLDDNSDMRSVLKYYAIELENDCQQSFDYSQKLYSFDESLERVVDELEFCFIDGKRMQKRNNTFQPLLYCFGRNAFQVNAITESFSHKSGLKTELIHSTAYRMPNVLKQFCKRIIVGYESGIKLRIDFKSDTKSEIKDEDIEELIPYTHGFLAVDSVNATNGSPTVVIGRDSTSYALIAVIMVLVVITLVFAIALIFRTIRRQRVSKM